MKTIQKSIEEHLQARDELLPIFKEWCKDKTVPLDERWELFISSDLGSHNKYVHKPEFIDWDNEISYEEGMGCKFTLYLPKFTYVNVTDLIDSFSDLKREGLDVEEEELKEYFLNEFVKSFVNDW